MTIQEIIDALDAEIKAKREVARKLKLNEVTIREGLSLSFYANGLQFAKDLIEKAKEVTE